MNFLRVAYNSEPQDPVEEIFERLAKILAEKVLERNRKGLYKGFVEKTKAASKIRGRVEVSPSSLMILKGKVTPICKYEENTADLPENQILLWTLYRLRQFDFKQPEVKTLVRLAYRELVDKVTLRNFVSQDCINRFYNRLNVDYRPIHGICRFFLEHTRPTLTGESHDFSPFLLNMPNLFQSFVAEYLKVKLTKFRAQPQYIAKLGESGFDFRIDLVIEDRDSGKTKCIMDTKYERSEQPRVSEIQQVIAYSLRMNTKSGFLIYPSTITKPFKIQVGDITVMSITFDLSQDIETAGPSFIRTIENL